ncbi:LOW QUALITY PROTEIN: adhesion G-protein coupled receptor G7 [Rhynochetos jubatus]
MEAGKDIESKLLSVAPEVSFCEGSTCTMNISENTIKPLTFEWIIVDNTSIAIWMCTREEKTPTLQPPKILKCNENLDSLALQVETVCSSNVSAMASNSQILTSMPDQLITQNVSAPVNIAGQILNKPNVSEDAQASVTVIATVSQLLVANETEFNHSSLANITTRTRKSSVTWTLVSLCSSMLILNIIFISVIENQNARNHSRNATSYYQQYLPCDVASITLHTSDMVDPPAESLPLRPTKPLPGHFLLTTSAIGWGIPAVVVAVTLGATRERKALNSLDQHQNFSVQKPMLWTFLLPVALMLLFNITTFIRIIVSVIRKKNKNLTSCDGTGLLQSFSKRVPQSLATGSDFLVTNSGFLTKSLVLKKCLLPAVRD